VLTHIQFTKAVVLAALTPISVCERMGSDQRIGLWKSVNKIQEGINVAI
jgi:hypothetical protein